MKSKYIFNHKLIITIVRKGQSHKVIEEAKKQGAERATVFFGRGASDRKIYEEILGLNYEPEKEVILTAVKDEIVDAVFNAICDIINPDKPNAGICFVVNIGRVRGIRHLIN